MAKDYIEDFFETVYNHELEQKQNLDSADGLLIGVMGALIGVGAYFLNLMSASSWCFSCILFWVLMVGFFSALTGGLFCCIRSSWPQEKAYIASPKTWGDYVAGLFDFHGNYHKGNTADDRVSVDLAVSRRQQYIEAGEINRNLVLRKLGWQVRAKIFMAIAVVIMFVAAIPASVMQLGVKEANTKAGDSVSNENQPATAGPAKPVPPPQPPQKPNPPAIVKLMEGDTSAKGK
jgi:hypothetical protein